jgi:NADH-quinone oxidoreductase subunit C
MTLAISGKDIAKKIEKKFPGCVAEVTAESLLVKAEALLEVATYLKNTPGLDFDYLTAVSGVDYIDCLEVVYHLTSIEHNHSLVLKTRCYSRENPTLPSVVGLWRTADFQEREIYDLLGIS